MTAMTANTYREGGMTSEERMVIFASSLGTVVEWYDFYIYGTLAPILATQFFSGVNPTAAFIFTLLAFAAGFAVRPFGALFFGRLGDMIGRKYTFLITMSLMGVSTFFIGLLPGYRSEERRVGKECRSLCDWSSDVCSSDLVLRSPRRHDRPQIHISHHHELDGRQHVLHRPIAWL